MYRSGTNLVLSVIITKKIYVIFIGICFENSCYLFTSKGTTWSENRQKCQGKGGDLVSTETEEEWSFINGEIQKRSAEPRDEWHIGLKKGQDDVWKWVNGKSLTISKWQVTEGQPSGDGDVTVMAKAYPSETQGLFNDIGDRRPRAYICEIPKGKRQRVIFYAKVTHSLL